MDSIEFTIATALVVEFAGMQSICVLPNDGDGAKTYCPECGATITYRPGFVSVQVTREGGGIVHSWILALRWNDARHCVGWFNGDTPTEGDLNRIRLAAIGANFDIGSALCDQDPRAYDSDWHLQQLETIIDAISVRIKQPTVLAKRGVKPGKHTLPGAKP